MIGYVTIGTNDMAKARVFYDAIAKELGGRQVMDMGSFVLWANGGPGGMLALASPYNKETATCSNGGMVALAAKDKDQVHRLHELALSLGGSDEGAPGARSDNFYASYFRDPEGNKLAAFVMT